MLSRLIGRIALWCWRRELPAELVDTRIVLAALRGRAIAKAEGRP
jgi:hypothetical protein